MLLEYYNQSSLLKCLCTFPLQVPTVGTYTSYVKITSNFIRV